MPGAMRILLIQPPIEDFYTTPIRLYPLGLLYVAQALRHFGCQVDLLDCLTPLKKKQLPIPAAFRYMQTYLQREPLLYKGYYRFGLSDDEILDRIQTLRPDAVGIAAQFSAYYHNVHQLTGLIKKRFDLPVFIGGSHATVFAAEIGQRTPEIDAILVGPVENALPQQLENLLPEQEQRQPALDWKIPMPAHDLAPSALYRMGRRPYVSLVASRGCPHRCEFCSVRRMFGGQIEYRSVACILHEMRWNYRHKGIRIFNFEDDNLSFDRRRFKTLLQAIAADSTLEGIELTAMNGFCFAHLDEELLHLMRQAGFRQLNLSLVTHNADLQQQYHRPNSRQPFTELIAAAQRHQFFMTVYVIIGLPDQTVAEAKATIDYLLSLGVLVGPSIFYIPPGSRLYERLVLPEEIRDDWNFYRSSVFAVETPHMTRDDLVDLFVYVRRLNLARRNVNHHPGGCEQIKHSTTL